MQSARHPMAPRWSGPRQFEQYRSGFRAFRVLEVTVVRLQGLTAYEGSKRLNSDFVVVVELCFKSLHLRGCLMGADLREWC